MLLGSPMVSEQKPRIKKSYLSAALALPSVLGYGDDGGSEAVGVEGAVADVAQQVAVVLGRLPAVEAPLALLAQPPGPYHGGDADMSA